MAGDAHDPYGLFASQVDCGPFSSGSFQPERPGFVGPPLLILRPNRPVGLADDEDLSGQAAFHRLTECQAHGFIRYMHMSSEEAVV